MTPDSEGLHEIASSGKPNRLADIVFIHGLAGGSHSTWRFGKEEASGHFFWLEALAEDLPDCGIWCLGYEAGKSHWFSNEGMALEDRASNLALKLTNNSFGGRPLIFIAHSMGGLVVKELVTAADALGGPDWIRVVNAVRGIVFLGTPHYGSHMATLAKGFAVLLRTQEHLKQMTFAGKSLDQLHRRFIKWRDNTKCPVEAYVETQGIARSGWLGLKRLLPRVLVVPEISGDPRLSGCDCHKIGADHISLVKPDSKKHDVYQGVRRFIENALQQAAPVVAAAEKSSARTLVYISYSRDDAAWHRMLRAVLDADPALRDRIWDDTRLQKTGNWQVEIPGYLARAKVVVMLASPSYFDPARMAHKWELLPSVEAEHRGELRIVWFPVRKCRYIGSPIEHIHASLPPGQPLDGLQPADQQEALREIHHLIRELLGVDIVKPSAPQSAVVRTPDAAPSRVSPPAPSHSSALVIWQKRLAFLQAEEAKAADAAQKFSIQQGIDDARTKIRELGG